MGPLESTISVLSNYATFSGRASPSEYWWFVGVWTVLYLAVLGLQGKRTKLPELVFVLVTAVPIMSVSFRRLQDAGFSGWWNVAELAVFGLACLLLIQSLPQDGDDPDAPTGRMLLPALVLTGLTTAGIIWHFSRPSDPAANAYGPPPFASGAPAT